MTITYIYHSCFMVETANCIIIFDYYKGELPAFTSGKKVFFLASHTHADHFNPNIFDYDTPSTFYILSKDIEDKVIYRKLTANHPDINITYVKARETYTFQTDDTSLVITTLKSTDKGVAYLVNIDNHTIYHAGDLNLWWTPKMDKSQRNNMLALFKREIECLRNYEVDAAFLPLDYRLGDNYATGLDMYCKTMKIKVIYPMHMWEHYEVIDQLKNEAFASDYKDRIQKICYN